MCLFNQYDLAQVINSISQVGLNIDFSELFSGCSEKRGNRKKRVLFKRVKDKPSWETIFIIKTHKTCSQYYEPYLYKLFHSYFSISSRDVGLLAWIKRLRFSFLDQTHCQKFLSRCKFFWHRSFHRKLIHFNKFCVIIWHASREFYQDCRKLFSMCLFSRKR